MEAFLRARGQQWVASGDSRITDNIACASIYLLDTALAAHRRGHPAPLTAAQHNEIGALTCGVSFRIATVIQESPAWRIAALVATARLLAPSLGLDPAARIAAAAAREFNKRLGAGTHEVGAALLYTLVGGAVQDNNESLLGECSCYIADRLASLEEPDVCRSAAAAAWV